MAAPVKPNKISVFGKQPWIWTPTLAQDAPSVATITGASALNVSCYWLSDTALPDMQQDAVELPALLCEKETFETAGQAKWTGGVMRYAIEPQAAPASNGKKAYETLANGAVGYLVGSLGLDVIEHTLVVGDFVNSYPVELGVPHIAPSGNGPDAIAIVTQRYFITAAPKENVALVA